MRGGCRDEAAGSGQHLRSSTTGYNFVRLSMRTSGVWLPPIMLNCCSSYLVVNIGKSANRSVTRIIHHHSSPSLRHSCFEVGRMPIRCLPSHSHFSAVRTEDSRSPSNHVYTRDPLGKPVISWPSSVAVALRSSWSLRTRSVNPHPTEIGGTYRFRYQTPNSLPNLPRAHTEDQPRPPVKGK